MSSAALKTSLIVATVAALFYAGVHVEIIGKVIAWAIAALTGYVMWVVVYMFVKDAESHK